MEMATPEELRRAAEHWDEHAKWYAAHPEKSQGGAMVARATRLATALRAAAAILESTARRLGLGG